MVGKTERKIENKFESANFEKRAIIPHTSGLRTHPVYNQAEERRRSDHISCTEAKPLPLSNKNLEQLCLYSLNCFLTLDSAA